MSCAAETIRRAEARNRRTFIRLLPQAATARAMCNSSIRSRLQNRSRSCFWKNETRSRSGFPRFFGSSAIDCLHDPREQVERELRGFGAELGQVANGDVAYTG